MPITIRRTNGGVTTGTALPETTRKVALVRDGRSIPTILREASA